MLRTSNPVATKPLDRHTLSSGNSVYTCDRIFVNKKQHRSKFEEHGCKKNIITMTQKKNMNKCMHTLTKFAQFECDHGSIERGHTKLNILI